MNSLSSSPQPARGLRFASVLRALTPFLASLGLATIAAPTPALAQSNLLSAGGFEGISSMTSYWPSTANVWGTESAGLSGPANGITPFGNQMLLLTHAGGGGAAQTAQIVHGPFVAGSVVTFSVKFNTWLAAWAKSPQTAAVVVQTNSGLALDGARYTSPTVTLDTDTASWQTATVTVTLPAATNYISAEIVLWQYSGALPVGTPLAYADDAVLTVVPPTVVYASGISPVIAYDPIFPTYPVNPDSSESKPVPTVGYDDPRWINPRPATAFPVGSHPWEFIAPYDFAAQWINAWPNMDSAGHGFPGNSNWGRWNWNTWTYENSIYQSWTKYSTTITGSGSFVLQFLADNASWIYINGELIGYQDYNWGTNGTGRYTINLTGNGPHELSFIIWDGGGLAGGKFRLETTQSFQNNNPGDPLPPPPPPPPPSDTTAPVISVPSDITTEATGPTGAVVAFTVTANDDKDGAVPAVASPASGSVFPLGTTAVGVAASDAAGNTATAEFDVTVVDTTPPAIDIATNVGPVEATSAAGAVVTFAVPGATDLVDGATAVSASPASGSTFALGTTTVTLSSSDSRGNASSRSFQVTVADTTAPAISAPADIVAEATSAAGASVSYSASASDLVDGSVAVSGSPASGSVFPLGSSSVALSASDAAGNASAGSFSVTVVDTTAPALTVPASQTLEATSAAGAVATFAASATDAVGVTSLTTSAASGSTFPLGSTTVNVAASDAAGNTSAGSFSVTVVDTTAPALTVPASQTLEATSAAGAVATFAASATDAVGVTSLTTSAASGSTFPLGSTTVSVAASDAAGNTSAGSFSVTVVDTTAPVLTLPANQVIEATSAGGAVASFTASATDLVGVTSLTTSAASGSLFPLGTTTVTVTAQDAAGNTTSGSFTVTVRDTTAPVIAALSNSAPTLWPPNHKMVPVTVSATVTDAVGLTSFKIVNVTSSEPDNGLGDGDTANDIVITGDRTLQLRAERSGKGNGRTYTITVQATDAAGNTTKATTTAFVPKSQGGK